MSEKLTKITEEQINSFEYFFKEVGDLTRWSEWEKVKGYFEEHHPELIKAMNDLKMAENTLNYVVDAVINLEHNRCENDE